MNQMKEAIQPEGLARPAAPYSPVVVSGDLVYTAGQVGFDESGQLTADDITGQTEQVFENLVACLRAAGCEPSDVIKVNAYLVDLDDFAAFNEVYKATFAQPYPARTTVGVNLPGGILVEVEAVARVPT
jgi:2-iminobutanoate/2-iminopropanoate deaminase